MFIVLARFKCRTLTTFQSDMFAQCLKNNSTIDNLN